MTRSQMCWIPSVLLAVTLSLAGCTAANSVDDVVGDPAASVEEGDGTKPARITVTKQAQQRLGIQTMAVVAGPALSGNGTSLVIPYAAVVYDADGKAWTFTSPSPLTYTRAPIVISSIDVDSATLSAGPAPGTLVVTVGAPELVGMEAGISGEE
jgi:hypothetical protein